MPVEDIHAAKLSRLPLKLICRVNALAPYRTLQRFLGLN